jgi:hypothetical protein
VARTIITIPVAATAHHADRRHDERAPPVAQASLDRRGQGADRRPAISSIGRQPAREDPLQPPRHDPGPRGPESAQGLGDSARTLERLERALAVQGGVHRNAEAELIGALVDRLVAKDLGRDVPRGPDSVSSTSTIDTQYGPRSADRQVRFQPSCSR